MHLPPLRHLAAATTLACATLSAQAQITTGAMTAPRMFHQASALADGRVLLTGGASNPSSAVLASTEIYDPASGTFQPQAPMLVAKREHAAVTLQDGRVLVAGGMTPNGTFSSFAEIFNPATGQWTAAAPMNTAFFRTMARLLPDGRVMVADRGGSGGHHAEIYDPARNSFSKSGDMVEQTSWHGMVVLLDGRVLKVGGYTANGYSRNAEIWDPATNQWSATGQLATERQDIQPVLLPDGKVLIAGGRSSMKLSSTEIFDPATGQFSPGGDMPLPFTPDSSTSLGDGTIVFTDPYARQLLQYQPASGKWNIAGPKRGAARETSVTRLPDGSLLLAGGAAQNDATTYAALFEPACSGQQLALSGTSATPPGDGGEFSFTVTGAPGCRFEAANVPSWLSPWGPSPYTMPASGSMSFVIKALPNPSGAERSASFYLANELVTVTQPVSATCPSMPYVSPTITKVGYQGGSGTAYVTAPANCPWYISDMPAFASITSAPNGKGNGSFSYSVPANPGSMSRSASGQLLALTQSASFTFTQDGPPQCPSAPSVSLGSTTFPAAGGTINATVSAAPTCPWNVSALPAWVKLASAGSGTGNGSFAITASANKGYALSGSGQVSGPGVASTFNLMQDASPCASWSINPASVRAPNTGASGSFTIKADASCSWSLGGAPSWITISGASSGSGNGTISYSIAPNAGTSRSTQLALTGAGPTLSLGISQDGPTATACSAPINNGVAVNGNLQSSGCPVGARGAGYYTDRYTFNSEPGRLVTIALSSTAFDTYLYLRNPAGTVIKSDDDSGGGTNSRISFTLPAGTAGTYTIEATSYASSRTGAYSLTLTQ